MIKTKCADGQICDEGFWSQKSSGCVGMSVNQGERACLDVDPKGVQLGLDFLQHLDPEKYNVGLDGFGDLVLVVGDNMHIEFMFDIEGDLEDVCIYKELT